MRSSGRFVPVYLLIPAILAIPGCGGGLEDTPPLAKVTGTVKYAGQPLTEGMVQFIPDSSKGTSGRMALGKIQPDGTYELMTLKPGDGAQVGFHKVIIQSYETAEFNPDKPVQVQPQSRIPDKYSNEKTSGLTAEVKAGQENVIPFSLD